MIPGVQRHLRMVSRLRPLVPAARTAGGILRDPVPTPTTHRHPVLVSARLRLALSTHRLREPTQRRHLQQSVLPHLEPGRVDGVLRLRQLLLSVRLLRRPAVDIIAHPHPVHMECLRRQQLVARGILMMIN